MISDISSFPNVVSRLAGGGMRDPRHSLGDIRELSDVERAVTLGLDQHRSWMESKCRLYRETEDESSASAILGEIRAYGVLASHWAPDQLETPTSGSDFHCIIDNQHVHIEVHTPHGRADISRTTIDHGDRGSGRIQSRVAEIAPMGLPQRPGADNVQGEAVSYIAARKGDESQFKIDCINVLWLDFRDSRIWPMDIMSDQVHPLTSFNGGVTSGALWNAFYATKGLPIFSHLDVDGVRSNVYEMEYDARFQGSSVLDYVIINLQKWIVAYANPSRGHAGYGRDFFSALHRSPDFRVEFSWLPIPDAASLQRRIHYQLSSIRNYRSQFQRP